MDRLGAGWGDILVPMWQGSPAEWLCSGPHALSFLHHSLSSFKIIVNIITIGVRDYGHGTCVEVSLVRWVLFHLYVDSKVQTQVNKLMSYVFYPLNHVTL